MAVLSGVHLARADDGAAAVATPAPLSESLTGPAHTDYEVGRVLFKDGDYAGALAKFQAAYDKSKDGRLLYNLAACQRSLHHYATTMRLLSRYERDAQLSADDRKEADDILTALKQYVAPLRLAVSEPDASVAINGEDIGKTPLASPVLVDFGPVEVRVTKRGFADHVESFEVKDQGEISKAITLDKPEGRLVVTSLDAATIDVDGKFASRGHIEVTLSLGPHQIKVTAPGYRSYQSEVTLTGKLKSLSLSLEKEKRGGLPLWAWIGGSILLVGGLSVGGYFVYRAATQSSFTPVAGTLGGVQLNSFHW